MDDPEIRTNGEKLIDLFGPIIIIINHSSAIDGKLFSLNHSDDWCSRETENNYFHANVQKQKRRTAAIQRAEISHAYSIQCTASITVYSFIRIANVLFHIISRLMLNLRFVYAFASCRIKL